MKGSVLFSAMYVSTLYIPHGSDESIRETRMVRIYPTLYPTWFRWKCPCFGPCECVMVPLYPTWFRWKSSSGKGGKALNTLYIPHGSDERLLVTVTSVTVTRLYIPHGSDESMPRTSKRNTTINFISHMVQMKVTGDVNLEESGFHFISHMVQMKEQKRSGFWMRLSPLYPTWFRWKIDINCLRCSISFFISHMVQMKASNGMGEVKKCHLYIPHGSDERFQPWHGC